MLEMFTNHIESLTYGWISLIVEVLFVLIALIAFFVIAIKHVPARSIILIFIADIVFIATSIFIGSKISTIIYSLIFIMVALGALIYYLPEYRQFLSKKVVKKQSKEFLSNQEVKEELIETLLKAVNHLSNRKIGAIITIEKEHTLNTFVEGAVQLDAVVTYELLETIFHPNTALHDGAVIIRGNHIKCASAFYQPSQKKDIPQHYGSRHRAAIGISEQSDAFTIVVSEETGHIAITIGGTITGNVSLESLRTSLNQHLIVR